MADKSSFRVRIIEIHNYKSLLGPCFITFSIPLLVPGVSLTLVGIYSDSDIFPLFGGWHITGILFLSLAVILLISGIVLRCVFRPVISPDVEQHLTPAPSFYGKSNKAYEHEKRLETINGIYKDPNAHKTGHTAHKLVSTNHKELRPSGRTPSTEILNSNVDGDTQTTHHRSRSKKHSEASIAPVLNAHQRPNRGDRDSDTESSLDRRRSRGNSRRSRSSDVDSDTPLNADRDFKKDHVTAHDRDSSDSGQRSYDYASQERRKKRKVSKAPSFGLNKQTLPQTSSAAEGAEVPLGDWRSATRTSVTSDAGSVVTITSGTVSDPQGLEHTGSDPERHHRDRKRRKRKKRRHHRDGSESAIGSEVGADSAILPELRVKPNVTSSDHQGVPHHVIFATEEIVQDVMTHSPKTDFPPEDNTDGDHVFPKSILHSHRRRSSESDA